MNSTLLIILYAASAGFPIFLGGLISHTVAARQFSLKDEVNHFIVAFGGGALLSAIAFVLVPRAVENLPDPALIALFLGGTLAFMGLDILSQRLGGSLSMVISMMMDFIPEALALGASFAHDQAFGLLIAIFIGLQNLPEGYNSYLELKESLSSKKVLILMFLLSFVGIFSALFGEFVLSSHPRAVESVMLFAAGGILYLVFQDVAPAAKIEKRWVPATGAGFGFLLGIIGEKMVG